MFFSICIMCSSVINVLSCMLVYLISLLIVYSLLNAGLLIMGKSSGASFLSKFKGLTRSGRAHKVPPNYLRMTPHGEVEGSGEETLEEEAVGGEPLEEEEVEGEAVGAKNSGSCPK